MEQAQQGRQPLPRLTQILPQPRRAAPPAQPRQRLGGRQRGGRAVRLGRGGLYERPQGVGVQQARLVRLRPPPRRLQPPRAGAGTPPGVRSGGGGGGWLRGGGVAVGGGLRGGERGDRRGM